MILNVQKQNLEGENFNVSVTKDRCKDQDFLQEKWKKRASKSQLNT